MTYDVEKKRSGRRPFTVVDVEMDFCSRTFGTSPCLATGEACYNTRASCKFGEAYDITKKTYSFCTPVAFIPPGLRAYPVLDGVSMAPAKVDPGKGMGLRASVSIRLKDFNHNDYGIDPYVTGRPYDPLTQGSFLGRFRARNPYYNGRTLKVKTGYLTEDGVYDASNFITKTYFIESWAGPNADGIVTIEAKDILKLVDDDRAVAPALSRGKLSAAINSSVTSAALSPAGIGSEYPASGIIRMRGELMDYTRSGDVLTLTRGQYNTAAVNHSIDEIVQDCLAISGGTVQDIAYTLLTAYGKVDPAFIDKDQWDAEQAAYLPRLYSTIITSPTGVNKLLTELCEQVGVMFYWDEVDSLINFQSVRPNGEDDPIVDLTSQYNLYSDSTNLKDLDGQRVNEVWVYYGVYDYTKSLTDESNYKKTYIAPNLFDQSEAANNDVRIKRIFSRWITELNTAAAEDLGDKIVARYQRAPREVTFTIDAKDSAIPVLGFVSLENRQAQTFSGDMEQLTLQVIERKEIIQGTSWSYVAREFAYSLASDSTHLIKVDADRLTSINIRDEHDLLYSEAKAGDMVVLLVKSGTMVTGTTPADYAIRTGTFAAGVTLKIVIESGAIVAGRGGKGADAYWYRSHFGSTPPGWPGDGAGVGQDGGNGGDAVLFEFPTLVDNNGVISGGSGGGGNGCSFVAGDNNSTEQSGAGGGGAPYGEAGSRGFQHEYVSGVEYYFADNSTAGAAGGRLVGGSGGAPWYGDDGIPGSPSKAAAGGAGGALGAVSGSAGSRSAADTASPTTGIDPGNGGSPGAAVVGNSYVTWINTGTRYGSIS